MKNKKIIVTVVVLVIAIGAYFGVTRLQQNFNRQALDDSASVVKEEGLKEEKKEEITEVNNKPSEPNKEETKNKEVQQNNNSQNKEEPKQNNTEQKPKAESNSTQTQKPTNNKPEEKKVSNFSAKDSVSGKIIVSGYISIKDGETAENATERFLRDNGVSFKNKDGYISRIGELKERDNGPNSGWCYYINGVKASVGMRNITLKTSDKIEWRYLADGVSN